MHDALMMGIPVAEKIGRTVVVYLAIVLLLRLLGRRDLAQFTTFDLVVVLLLSNVVQNAIIGPDDSVTGGLIGALTLLVANAALVRVGTSSDMAERLFQGSPLRLVEGGHFERDTLRRLGVRPHDVDAALREQGAPGVGAVDHADLLPSGTLVVQLADDAQAATKGDVRAVLERLERMEEALAAATRQPPPAPGTS
jgi:uncharacterized membrane protein YcaP (DUF421 family)